MRLSGAAIRRFAENISSWYRNFNTLPERKLLLTGLETAGVKAGGEWIELVTTNLSGHREVEGATTIDVATAKELHDRAVAFVDVSASSVAELIPRAHRLDFYREFDELRLLELVNKSQEIVIYGRVESEPTNAAAKAVTWGFERVYYFVDGISGWRGAGYPVE